MTIPMENVSDYDELKHKRTKSLIGVWQLIVENKLLNSDRFELSMPLVNEVTQHYIMDNKVLKKRYNIDNLIQPHKIAGLMASSILRFRPIVPVAKLKEYENENEMYANELLSILHGLAVCGEFSSMEHLETIMKENWFNHWFNHFLYLLHHRHHTPESLCFIFATLSYFKFPDIILENTVDN